MFGVPLSFRKAFGYLYHDALTSDEEAIADFSKIKNIDANTCRKIKWQQYYKNNAMEGRILYMGNRLYFFEPHQAIPLHYYVFLTSKFLNAIINYQDNEIVKDKPGSCKLDDLIDLLLPIPGLGCDLSNFKQHLSLQTSGEIHHSHIQFIIH